MKTIPFGTSALLLCALPALAQVPVNQEPVTEEITITASPLIGDAIDQSQSVAQVSREDLLSSGGFGLGDALKDVAGVTSSSFSPGAVRPVIRGFDAARVRVTENGIGSHDVSDISGDHGVPIDPLSSIEVEVLRGPGTLRYGSQAIGGVVNAINNRIPFDIAEGTRGELFTGGATNAFERNTGALLDHRAGPWAFHADGVLRGADDYDNALGRQDNTYAFGRGFAVGGAYSGPSAAGASYSHYFSHYGIATEPGGEISHIDLEQANYNAAARLTEPLPGVDNVSLRGGYSNYSHDEIVAGSGVLATFNNNEWEGRAEAVHGGFGPITTGAAGVQWSTRDFEALGEGADYLLPTKTDSIGAYLFERFAISDTLTLEAAGRAEQTILKGGTNAAGNVRRSFEPSSLAAGVVFHPTDALALSLSLSHTERAPNAAELFAQGAHEASATFEFGDPTLKRERARSAEVSVHYDGMNTAHLSASVFRSAFAGFITGVLTGNSYDEDGNFFPDNSQEFAELFYIQRNATFWGIEGQAHLPLTDLGTAKIGIDIQGDYVRASFDGGGNVPRIPPLRFGGGVFYESEGTQLKLGFTRTEPQDDVAINETPTRGYTILEASATFRVWEREGQDLDLTVSGSNLTDEVARNHVSFTKDHVLLPGRNVRLMLHYSF